MAELALIPQSSMDDLLANPESAGAFDSVYGKGRAASVLAARSPAAPAGEAEAQVKPDRTRIGKVWDATFRGFYFGVQEAANETISAVGSFDEFMGKQMDDWGIKSAVRLYDTNEDGTTGRFNPHMAFYSEGAGDAYWLGGTIGEDPDTFRIGLVDEPSTTVGGVVGSVSQFIAGFVGAGKVTKLVGLKGALVNGALADAIAINPNEPNLLAMLDSEFGIDAGLLTEALATDTDDPEYINRLRNVAEGTLLGGAMEALGWGIRAAKARHAGKPKEAAKFSAKIEGAIEELSDAAQNGSKEYYGDAQKTIDLASTIFDDITVKPQKGSPAPDGMGQYRLDLGDTPLPKSAADGEDARLIYQTPETAEKVRLQVALARHATPEEKIEDLSYGLWTATSYDDVLDEIAGTQAVYADAFKIRKGGDVQTFDQVKIMAARALRELAEHTNEDPKALIRRFASADFGDIANISAEILARARYIKAINIELKSMAQVIADAADGKVFSLDAFPGMKDIDELHLAYFRHREVAVELLAGNEALRSNVGRALNAMKIKVEGDESIQAMLRDPASNHDIIASARAIVDPKNVDTSAIRVIDDTLERLHGYMDGINTFRINALLSGPGTQEVNLISNLINGLVIPVGQGLGGAAIGDRRLVVHALRQLQGSTAGLFDSVGAAAHAGWHSDAVLDPFSLKVDHQSALQGAKTAAGKIIRFPTRALMTTDEFFKQSQYRGVIFADANRLATDARLKGNKRREFIEEYLRKSYTKTGQATRGDALLQARRATFTEPLEPGLGLIIQNAAIKSAVVRNFLPFVRTPVNLLSQTYQHVPILGLASKRMRADLRAGGARAAQARGRQIIGTGLVAMAGWAAASGKITGSGPTDPRVRKVWLANNQPNSFRIVNDDGTVTWVSFARMEPFSNIFSVAADAVEIMEDRYNENERYGIIQSLTMAVLENTVNKTFTKGVHDLMLMLVGRPEEQARALRNYVASYVPNLLNQTNGDMAFREARNYTDTILARTSLYNLVDPKRNALGEIPTRRLPKWNPQGLGAWEPQAVDTVMAEITKMAIINQTVAGSPSRFIDAPKKIDLATIPYKEGQSLYDKWLELTGEVKIGGKTVRQRLAHTFETNAYLRAPEGHIGSTAKTKGAIIRKIIVQYREKAKGRLPELLEIIKAAKRGDALFLREQYSANKQQLLFQQQSGEPKFERTRSLFGNITDN